MTTGSWFQFCDAVTLTILTIGTFAVEVRGMAISTGESANRAVENIEGRRVGIQGSRAFELNAWLSGWSLRVAGKHGGVETKVVCVVVRLGTNMIVASSKTSRTATEQCGLRTKDPSPCWFSGVACRLQRLLRLHAAT